MDFDNTQPIWLQLVAEFSRRIAVGEWEPGAKIPGVRELAGELGVNPNTVQRSLTELEREGLCHVERTLGRFVTTENAHIDKVRWKLASTAAAEFVTAAHGLQMGVEQATELIEKHWKDTHDNS